MAEQARFAELGAGAARGLAMSMFSSWRHALCGLLLAVGVPGLAHAAHLDISAGGSMTSQTKVTKALFLDLTVRTHVTRDIHWQPAFTFGWLGRRHTHAERLHHDVFVAGAGIRAVNWWRSAFFSFQLGLAGGRTDALSSTGQFISTLGWQRPRYELMLRHISNGHFFRGKNLGETMLLIGVRI